MNEFSLKDHKTGKKLFLPPQTTGEKTSSTLPPTPDWSHQSLAASCYRGNCRYTPLTSRTCVK